MLFVDTSIAGAFVIEPSRQVDARGFFARTWCRREWSGRRLRSDIAQCSISFNAKKGTIRGLHYQVAPDVETKVVRCTMGAIWDVIVDLRPESPTFGRWFGIELNASNRLSLYVPERVAHGFQTLEDDAEVSYQICGFYSEPSARTVRWNDPVLGIDWPVDVTVISERDASAPLLSALERPAPERLDE